MKKPTIVDVDSDVERGCADVVRLRREEPPKHCILKVDSFSMLQTALSDTSFESTQFSAGGHTWVMTVYQNGNKKEQGEGYLSLYVSMVDEASNSDVVRAQLRFLVYDQIRDNYLCVQCVIDKRFYVMQSTWGIPQFLSLATFTDASNGFLVNDRCVFGAEVLLPDGCVRIPSLSIVDKGCKKTFTWRIEKFSEQVQPLESANFSVGEWTWGLKLSPKGSGREEGKSVSLFLYLRNADKLTCGSKLYAKYTLSTKNQVEGGDYNTNTVSGWFTSKITNRGYYNFLGLDEFYNSKKCLLIKDALLIEVRMEVMFVLKDDKAE